MNKIKKINKKKLNKKNPLFITFEGIEGAGKSSVLKLLEKKLIKHNIPVFTTREPGGGGKDFTAEKIRNLIMQNKSLNVLSETLLFEAARSEHIEKIIKPNLEKGKIVICDRFTDSTIIYQGIVKKLGIEKVKHLNKIATDGLKPDLTFIFDLSPENALKRIKLSKKRGLNRFDVLPLSFHSKIRNEYLNLAAQEKRFVILNAEKNINQLINEIFLFILNKLDL